MEILSFKETKNLLLKYGLPFCETGIFDSLDKAIEYAEEIGYPVVLKVYGKDVFHRTETGGVAVGIKNKEGLKKEWEAMAQKFNNIEGFLVQEAVKGREFILGMKRDEQFGPVLMFGLGGVFAELFKDVSLRIAPIGKKEAEEMLEETKAYEIIKGFRGQGVNKDKLVDLLVRLSKLSVKERMIKSIDFNPVMGNEKEVLIVDFKIVA
ncbi:MAG: acetate--CoA ligase family protein [Candidatus Pacebacteria bacterium]|nr:acetate--CoA ligase family protein [Candidatus Paceibacterota bacterium]